MPENGDESVHVESEEHRLAAILVGDVAGYTRLIAEDEDHTARTLRACQQEIELLVGQHRVRLVDFAARDGFLASFPSAVIGGMSRLHLTRGSVYPEASLFRTRFSEHALSVYENRFVIGVAIDIDETLEPGSRQIGATLRYQACTERVCFPPTHRQAELRVSVVSERSLLASRHAAVFDSIQFSGRE